MKMSLNSERFQQCSETLGAFRYSPLQTPDNENVDRGKTLRRLPNDSKLCH